MPDDFVLDHKIPISRLTTKAEIVDETNLVVACRKCNQAKGNMDYEEFLGQINVG